MVKRTKRSRLSKPKASARAKITAGSSTSLTASAGTRYLALPRMEEKCMVPPSTKRAKGVVRSANCPTGFSTQAGRRSPRIKAANPAAAPRISGFVHTFFSRTAGRGFPPRKSSKMNTAVTL